MKIAALVKPRSKKEKVERGDDGVLRISVKEPPEDGKANKAAAEALAKFLKLPVAAVRLVSGASSKRKIFNVET
ncbi:MAG: DUF167 domain-containing protein [Patescibacteria group bacterium]|nr:DUF167 domain-containing protein [Patescibacteria group bacterium]